MYPIPVLKRASIKSGTSNVICYIDLYKVFCNPISQVLLVELVRYSFVLSPDGPETLFVPGHELNDFVTTGKTLFINIFT